MTVGQRIKARLAALQSELPELSQAEVARRVGMSQSGMVNLIAGRSRTTTYLHKIARELRTTPAYLAGEIDDPSPNAPPPAPPAIQFVTMSVALPSEAELAAMFRALLAGINSKATQAEQALLLAQRLPIGLSRLQAARSAPGRQHAQDQQEAAADEDVAMLHHEPQR